MSHDERSPHYAEGSLSLTGAVSMGTGVIIGAGIFALTGQVAEMAGEWFPLAFLAAALVSALSAYSYVKMSNAYPSAGGIVLDAVVLIALLIIKVQTDMLVIYAAGAGMVIIFVGERLFLRSNHRSSA